MLRVGEPCRPYDGKDCSREKPLNSLVRRIHCQQHLCSKNLTEEKLLLIMNSKQFIYTSRDESTVPLGCRHLSTSSPRSYQYGFLLCQF